jgi:hypothetical protein
VGRIDLHRIGTVAQGQRVVGKASGESLNTAKPRARIARVPDNVPVVGIQVDGTGIFAEVEVVVAAVAVDEAGNAGLVGEGERIRGRAAAQLFEAREGEAILAQRAGIDGGD